MSLPSPFTSLAVALQHACAGDLPPYPVTRQHPVATRAETDVALDSGSGTSGLSASARAVAEQCEVVMFPQSWPTTALGYGDRVVDQATVAYTVIVRWQVSSVRAVYFGASGKLAYLIPSNSHQDQLQQCIGRQAMPDVRAAAALGWTSKL